MKRREILTLASGAVATSIAGCSEGSSDSGSTPTADDAAQGDNTGGDSSDSGSSDGGDTDGQESSDSGLGEPTLDVGSEYTCKERQEPEMRTEDGKIIIEWDAFGSRTKCADLEPGASWNPNDDGTLLAELHADSETASGCQECDGQNKIPVVPITWKLPEPDGDKWNGDVTLVLYEPDGSRMTLNLE